MGDEDHSVDGGMPAGSGAGFLRLSGTELMALYERQADVG
jgi:hypothetical protein